MSIKIEDFPRCPKCKCRQTIGKVKSYNIEKGNYMSAFYCSNCLTEFDSRGTILRPLWSCTKKTV